MDFSYSVLRNLTIGDSKAQIGVVHAVRLDLRALKTVLAALILRRFFASAYKAPGGMITYRVTQAVSRHDSTPPLRVCETRIRHMPQVDDSNELMSRSSNRLRFAEFAADLP